MAVIYEVPPGSEAVLSRAVVGSPSAYGGRPKANSAHCTALRAARLILCAQEGLEARTHLDVLSPVVYKMDLCAFGRSSFDSGFHELPCLASLVYGAFILNSGDVARILVQNDCFKDSPHYLATPGLW